MSCLFCKKEMLKNNICSDCGKYNVCQACCELIKIYEAKKSYHCYWCDRHLPKEEEAYYCKTCSHIACEKCTTAEHFDDTKYCNKCGEDLEEGY